MIDMKYKMYNEGNFTQVELNPSYIFLADY